MALTDKLRAAVFARDKAICAFSGLSVWMLDYGISSIFNHDWPDHIKPASKGGKDTLSNLVCASYFYNSKKSDGGRDNAYLFIRGRPTIHMFWTHGGLTAEHVCLTHVHKAITEKDWYFNRALANILLKLNRDYEGFKSKSKNPHNWTAAAIKKLRDWKKIGGKNDFLKRGLVRFPTSPDVKLMLDLADTASASNDASIEKETKAIIKKMKPYYKNNSNAIASFIYAESRRERSQILKNERNNELITEPVWKFLTKNNKALELVGGSTALEPVPDSIEE